MPAEAVGEPWTLRELREALAEILEVPPESIDADTNLLRLGVDSLAIMRLVNRWRSAGIRVSSRVLTAEPTLNDWLRHIESLRLATERERLDVPAVAPSTPR